MKRILLYFVIVFLLSANLFAQNMQVVGSAIQLDSHCYRLTPTQMFQIGAMWNPTPISLSQDFEVEVLANFDCFDADGADGVVFTLQPMGTSALGTTGEDMGFGFISPSFGVEFDTYQDFNKDDPTFDHIAVVKNGDVAHWSNNTLVQPIQASVLSANIEDCNDHLLKIEWDAATHTISVYFDCVLRVTYSNDIASTIFGGSDMVYWGFTAATGGFFSNQDICFIDNTVSLPSQTICEGESTIITAPFGTGYSWSPTTGLSNPNVRTPTASPAATTNYTVTVTSYCGNTATYQYTVNVNPKPEPVFSGVTDFCSEIGSTTISVQNNFVNYSWEGGGNSFSKQFGESNVASVTVTDSNGCTGSSSTTITEHFNPTPSISGTTNFCSGFSTTLSVENTYSSYTWNLGSNSSTQSVSQAGTVSVVVADAFGCEGTAATNVTENSF
ncbi:MAG TPA: L-type lectin-domain containing protein, partial [Chitinophagales bacterium]|nr:L-type lectin-domain containing protein [Chitinophagales bacterium]